MSIPSLVTTTVDSLWTASQDAYLRSESIYQYPATVMTLIGQAELKIRDLQQWRDQIHDDANQLLAHIDDERVVWSMELKTLEHEIALLKHQSAGAEAAAFSALADREDALMLCAAADARTMLAEQRAVDAEIRACLAEEWLSQLQNVLTTEFIDKVQTTSLSDDARR